MKRTVALLIWSWTASAGAPVWRAVLARRLRRGKEIAGRLPERFGIEATPRPKGKLLWLHAASVGEAVSALPVLEALPDSVSVVFTTGTLTSQRLLEQRLPELGLAGRVMPRFAPLDVPAWGGRFLDHWRPDAACFLESELWPNTLASCASRNIPLALINARMSVSSATWWCNLPGFAAETIGRFQFIAAQSRGDAERLRSLAGVRAGEIVAQGNLKYAAPPLPADKEEVARLSAPLDGRPRWVMASTHPGEEALAARVHARLASTFPGLVTAIVPRHPERGAAIAAELGGAGRRSLGQEPAGIWIADTLGELGLIYRLFPIVVMGKSFVPPGGGQNPLEPARLGCAIAMGPHHGNFDDPVEALRGAGGLTVLPDEEGLVAWLDAILRDAERVRSAGELARAEATREADLPSLLAGRLIELLNGFQRPPAFGEGSGEQRPPAGLAA